MGEINYKKLIAAANAIDRGMVEKDTKGEYAGHIKTKLVALCSVVRFKILPSLRLFIKF